MIECCEEKLVFCKNKKTGKKRKKFFAFFLVIFLIFGSFLYYKNFIVRQVISICNDYCCSYATEAVNEAVLESLSASVKYSDLINVEKNSAGDIVFMNTDAYKVNLINREITEATQKKLKERLKKGVPIPFFAFFGIDIISGYGFIVNYKSILISGVDCSFGGEFKSVGINQTLHSLYASVTCKICVEMPFSRSENLCDTQILISEAVLVGKVPDIYLKGGLIS